MTSQNPKISVIMPNFNSEKFLPEAISSILNQTFTDFEFIIIDDGSTDNSVEIIKNFKKRDSRIIFLQNKKNEKICKTLNRGLRIAKWEFIARMDSDDISLPERFSKQLEVFAKNSKIGVVGTAVNFINKKNERIFSKKYPNKNFEKSLWLLSSFCHPSVMIRRECFEIFGFYSTNFPYAEDLELWFRLSSHYQFYNLNEILFLYRISGKNTTLLQQKQMIKSTLAVRKFYKNLWYPMDNLAKISYFSVWALSFFPQKFIFYFSQFFQIFYVKISNFITHNDR